MAPSMTLPLWLRICMIFLRRSSYARRLSKAGPKSRCLDSCATSMQFLKYFAACKQDHFFRRTSHLLQSNPCSVAAAAGRVLGFTGEAAFFRQGSRAGRFPD